MAKDSYMQLVVILVVAVLIVQVVSFVELMNGRSGPQGNPSGNLKYITVTASGSASSLPTQGTVYINAQGVGKTGAAATANLSVVLTQLNSTILKYLNGNLSNMQTTYYNLYNQTNYRPCYYAAPAQTGNSVNASAAIAYPCVKNANLTYNYLATEQITISIPNVKNMSGAIGALSAINGIQINSAQATLSNQQITALRNQAYSGAMSNATSQAQAIVGNASLTPANITISPYYSYPIPYALGGSASAINSATPVNPMFYSGTESVTEQLTVIFSYSR